MNARQRKAKQRQRAEARGAHRDRPGSGSNVNNLERVGSALVGGMLMYSGLRHGGLGRWLRLGAGSALLQRGITGSCQVYRALGINTREDQGQADPAAEQPAPTPRGANHPPHVQPRAFRDETRAVPASPRDVVEESSQGSFPASDPPSRSSGHA